MQHQEISDALGKVREANEEWDRARKAYQAEVKRVMNRLLHEAARARMSVDQVAKESGYTPVRVRAMMRDAGLNPKAGRNLLSKQAAEALYKNAALLGVDPTEIDLTSPLAYLPMGDQLARDLRERNLGRVTGEEELG